MKTEVFEKVKNTDLKTQEGAMCFLKAMEKNELMDDKQFDEMLSKLMTEVLSDDDT